MEAIVLHWFVTSNSFVLNVFFADESSNYIRWTTGQQLTLPGRQGYLGDVALLIHFAHKLGGRVSDVRSHVRCFTGHLCEKSQLQNLPAQKKFIRLQDGLYRAQEGWMMVRSSVMWLMSGWFFLKVTLWVTAVVMTLLLLVFSCDMK